MSISGMDLEALYDGLTARHTPQKVAWLLAETELVRTLPAEAQAGINHLSRAHMLSSMTETYRAPAGMGRSLEAAHEALAPVAPTATPPAPGEQNLDEVGAWIKAALESLGFSATTAQAPVRKGPRTTDYYSRLTAGARGSKLGHVDIRDRYDSAELAQHLPGVSTKQYLKAVRAVAHAQQRFGVHTHQVESTLCVRMAKSRMAHLISFEDFSADPATAAFVAYYVARLGMRTEFTIGAQARPMDELGEALLENAYASPGFRADVVAKVLTRQKVLNHLTEAQKGELLSAYYGSLTMCGSVLARLWDPTRDRVNVTVRRGDDSSTWNAASRAWNQARTGWLNLLVSMGLRSALDRSCPGKVPALIAGDVSYWHDMEGDTGHGDIGVWATLPLPWEVLVGTAECTAEMVEDACRAQGLEAQKTGWVEPYRQTELEATAPAPELVHGVEVGSPQLAALLRTAGIFSGKLR